MNSEYLEKLLASKKYRDVCPDTVRRVWTECEAKYKKVKDIDSAAREALHGITGAFMTPEESRQLTFDMQSWHCTKADLSLERMLSRHASTRERLPLADMDDMYKRIFAITGKPQSVLDLACGINPIYLGARGIEAFGVDVSGSAVEAVNRFGEIFGMPVRAVCADLLCKASIPKLHFDLALLFKLLPLLERQRKGSAMAVMNEIDADHIVVSFPTRTLGGRNVGMGKNYSEWMEAHSPDGLAVAGRLETENELVYVFSKHSRSVTQA